MRVANAMRVASIATVVVLAAVGCVGQGVPTATPSPTATPTATATPQPTRTPTPTIVPTLAVAPTPSPTPTVAPTPAVKDPRPQDRDLFGLAQRLVLKSGESIPRVVNPAPVSYAVGRKDRFSVTDTTRAEAHTVTATLWLVSDHAYWYVDDNTSFKVDALRESAKVFEEQIYPGVTRIFGREVVPGVDNDVHLTILNTPLRGVAGYYSSADEYPAKVHALSNQREMLYLDLTSTVLNTPDYFGTLAHELTHAVQFAADPTEETWVNEGLAEMGKQLAGYTPGFRSAFLASPSISLTIWPQRSASTIPHYGGASLFMEYLAEHYGVETLRTLQDQPANSIQGVEAYLAAVKAGRSFREVFADWIVANYLDDPRGGVYSYPGTNVRVAVSDVIDSPKSITAEVAQYAARYYDLRLKSSEVAVTFKGRTATPLLPVGPPGGGDCWWSNHGDSIDTTLTRSFKLPPGNPLTLGYSLWYELESGWDFAYVEVSTDGGTTWDVLRGSRTTSENPVGNAFGPGYTGDSGGWVDDRVDLTPYAGKEVLLRFEYVTDDAIHGAGLCVTNISVPAAVTVSTPEKDDSLWETRGFIRTNNRDAQSYIVRIIEMGAEPRVRDIPLDANQEATFTIKGLDSGVDRAVIVIAATAELAMLPGSFQLLVAAP
ncbi:MAG: immune inhibitor A [Chloroflexi bacterium]|nr:immune inhibitor A [Chloroflexota bacterium]